MQIAVVEGGSDLFDSLAYGAPQPGVYEFLANRAQQFSANLTSAGQAFVENVHTYYKALSESEAAQMARAAARKVQSIWNLDTIKHVTKLAEFQHAGMTMQRWIMAEPVTRTLYHTNQCEGYADSYVDVEPNKIGESHYDYRRVMNGIVVDDGKGGWKATTYCEDLRDGDADLAVDEQADIINTWKSLRTYIQHRKEDPTSRWNNTL